MLNSTESSDNFTSGSETSSKEAAAPSDGDGETISYEHEDEVIENIEENDHDNI